SVCTPEILGQFTDENIPRGRPLRKQLGVNYYLSRLPPDNPPMQKIRSSVSCIIVSSALPVRHMAIGNSMWFPGEVNAGMSSKAYLGHRRLGDRHHPGSLHAYFPHRDQRKEVLHA